MEKAKLLEMAALERALAAKIEKMHPHYFVEDDTAAWHARSGAILRAEALEMMAHEAEAEADLDRLASL